MRLRPPRVRVLAAALVVAALAAGCTGQASESDSARSTDVEFTACADTGCVGTLPNGARYRLETPGTWNGTLLIYSHHNEVSNDRTGSTKAGPSADEDPGSPDRASEDGVLVAPPVAAFEEDLSEVILDAGFALAGTETPDDAWPIGAQMDSIDEVYRTFVESVGTPQRVYVYGTSTGGLASVRMAERGLEWVSAVGAMCAPLAGTRPTFDLALDAAVATRELLYRDMILTGFESAGQARKVLATASRKVRNAAEGDLEQRAKVTMIAALLDGAGKTETGLTGTDADVVVINNLLARSTVDRYEVERSVGGNPSQTFGTDYRPRLSDAEIDAIAGLTQDEDLPVQWLAKVQAAERIMADPLAEAQVSSIGDVTGRVAVPTVVLHTAEDQVFAAQHVTWYDQRTAAVGESASANFLPLFTTSASKNGGVGHCNFTAGDVTGLLRVLNDWAGLGRYPSNVSVQEAFSVGSGVDPSYQAAPWPAARLAPQDEPLPDVPAAASASPTPSTDTSSQE